MISIFKYCTGLGTDWTEGTIDRSPVCTQLQATEFDIQIGLPTFSLHWILNWTIIYFDNSVYIISVKLSYSQLSDCHSAPGILCIRHPWKSNLSGLLRAIATNLSKQKTTCEHQNNLFAWLWVDLFDRCAICIRAELPWRKGILWSSHNILFLSVSSRLFFSSVLFR